jgi:hypothetical protein
MSLCHEPMRLSGAVRVTWLCRRVVNCKFSVYTE